MSSQVFLLKYIYSYSDSYLNTKYEGITRKTESDSSKNRSEITWFLLFPIVGSLTASQAKIMKTIGFQIYFPSYLVQFFELCLHIWHLGSYLKMFLGKINVFVEIYFFRVRGRFCSKNRVILMEMSTLEFQWILTKI